MVIGLLEDIVSGLIKLATWRATEFSAVMRQKQYVFDFTMLSCILVRFATLTSCFFSRSHSRLPLVSKFTGRNFSINLATKASITIIFITI